MAFKYYGKAEGAAKRIIALFESGKVPEVLRQVFIHRDDDAPCRDWSWCNQLLVALAGYDDARGFRQWQQVKRSVRKGERAFQILAPVHVKRRKRDDETGETGDYMALVGFRAVPVFGYDQTDGEALPGREQEQRFVEALPLIDVARSWGLTVKMYGGAENDGVLGWYRPGSAIALGVENLATWCHELAHAADDRLGNLKTRDDCDSEIVAELAGATLLECFGKPREADKGGCWQYVQRYAEKNKVQPLTACTRLLKRVWEGMLGFPGRWDRIIVCAG